MNSFFSNTHMSWVVWRSMGCFKGDYLWGHLVATLMVGNLDGRSWKTVHWSSIAQLHYWTCWGIMQHLQGFMFSLAWLIRDGLRSKMSLYQITCIILWRTTFFSLMQSYFTRALNTWICFYALNWCPLRAFQHLYKRSQQSNIQPHYLRKMAFGVGSYSYYGSWQLLISRIPALTNC